MGGASITSLSPGVFSIGSACAGIKLGASTRSLNFGKSSTILVQKGASLDLLLRIDVLPNLEFYVLDGAGPGSVQELLQEKMWNHTDIHLPSLVFAAYGCGIACSVQIES